MKHEDTDICYADSSRLMTIILQLFEGTMAVEPGRFRACKPFHLL